MDLSRLLRYRGSVRGRSACVARAAAFGAFRTLRQRLDEMLEQCCWREGEGREWNIKYF